MTADMDTLHSRPVNGVERSGQSGFDETLQSGHGKIWAVDDVQIMHQSRAREYSILLGHPSCRAHGR